MANGDNQNKSFIKAYIEFIVAIALAVLIAFLIAFKGPGDDQMQKAKVALAYGMLILLFMFGFLVLAAIARGAINISKILEEKGPDGSPSGSASMSRFQLLIFTFVIGLSFFLIVVSKSDFPTVNGGVLMLLGISATTYGVSKGIQQAGSGSDDGNGNDGGNDTKK
ncbi:MAG TPA: hypothetical protein VJA94_10535 [Candidatus Angelobacter sp.]